MHVAGTFLLLELGCAEDSRHIDSRRNLGHPSRDWQRLLEEAKVQGVISLSSTSRAAGHRSVHLLCHRAYFAPLRACQQIFTRW